MKILNFINFYSSNTKQDTFTIQTFDIISINQINSQYLKTHYTIYEKITTTQCRTKQHKLLYSTEWNKLFLFNLHMIKIHYQSTVHKTNQIELH